MDFGIISEGPTDQLVLENILFGFFEDKNLPVTPLQPKPGESGNWDKVFKYCASKDLEGFAQKNPSFELFLDELRDKV